MKLFRNKLLNCQIVRGAAIRLRRIYKLLGLERKEILIASVISVAAASFSLLPTIYAWLNTPNGYWFTGVSSFFDPWDINAYFSGVRQGLEGSWLYRDPYYPPDTRRLPVYLSYLFLGHLTRLFNLSIPFVYHAASFVLGIVFLLLVYFFVRFFLRDKFWSLLCLFIIAFGGGFGFMALGVLPDTAWPDATIFQTLHMPHLILDQLLFLAVIFFSYQALTKIRWPYSFWAAVAGFGLAFIHPYSLFVADVVLGILFVALWFKDRDWRRIKFLLPLVFVSITIIGYFFKIFYLAVGRTSELLVGKAPTLWLTPSPPIVFLGYGLVMAFALVGIYRLWKEKTAASLFLLSWFFGQFLVLYFPVSWQRIMIKSFFIVVCLLAVWGMRALRLRKNKVALVMILFLSILSNLTLQTYTVAIAQKDNPWVYLTVEEHDALVWLQQNSRGQTVLAPLQLATMVPANSDNFVYLAYYSVHLGLHASKKEEVERFYRGRLASPQEFLQKNQIDYVIVDINESDLGATDYLETVYENEKVRIFKVL